MVPRALPGIVIVLAGLAACLAPRPVAGQTVGASLQGIVTDSSGAAVPNADVVVISVATGAVKELKTDSSGRYRVPVLPPGEYEVHGIQLGVLLGVEAVLEFQGLFARYTFDDGKIDRVPPTKPPVSTDDEVSLFVRRDSPHVDWARAARTASMSPVP